MIGANKVHTVQIHKETYQYIAFTLLSKKHTFKINVQRHASQLDKSYLCKCDHLDTEVLWDGFRSTKQSTHNGRQQVTLNTVVCHTWHKHFKSLWLARLTKAPPYPCLQTKLTQWKEENCF